METRTPGGVLTTDKAPAVPLRAAPNKRRRLRVGDVDGDDGCDRRRQLYRMVGLLGDRGRLSFAEWCRRNCGSPFPPDKVAPAYSSAGYGAHEAVMDVLMLHMQYGGDLEVFLVELERRARRL